MLTPDGNDPNKDPNKNNPWKLEEYRSIRDMFHPFLYENHQYCEMSRRALAHMLNERDIYVKTIQIDVMDALLTDRERTWIYHLRDCCLFETHRRKWKFVLSEMMTYVHRRADYNAVQTLFWGSQLRVRHWLHENRTVQVYELDEEDVEYQRLNKEFEQEVLFHRIGAAPTEPTDDSYANLESIEESEVPIMPKEPVTTVPAHIQQDEAAALPLEAVEPSREIILYDDYPREFFYAHPELFDIHTTESLGKLFSDPEYIKQRKSRRKELKDMAKQRKIALAKYYEEKAEQAKIEEQKKPELLKQKGKYRAVQTTSSVPVEERNLMQTDSLSSTDFDDRMSWSSSGNPQMFSSSDDTIETQIPCTSRQNIDTEMPSTSRQNVNAEMPSTSYDSTRNTGAIRKQYFNKKLYQRKHTFASDDSMSSNNTETCTALDTDDEYLYDDLNEANQLPAINQEHSINTQMANVNFSEETTLPPIEPDFTNLPLPEIPEDKKFY